MTRITLFYTPKTKSLKRHL